MLQPVREEYRRLVRMRVSLLPFGAHRIMILTVALRCFGSYTAWKSARRRLSYVETASASSATHLGWTFRTCWYRQICRFQDRIQLELIRYKNSEQLGQTLDRKSDLFLSVASVQLVGSSHMHRTLLRPSHTSRVGTSFCASGNAVRAFVSYWILPRVTSFPNLLLVLVLQPKMLNFEMKSLSCTTSYIGALYYLVDAPPI